MNNDERKRFYDENHKLFNGFHSNLKNVSPKLEKLEIIFYLPYILRYKNDVLLIKELLNKTKFELDKYMEMIVIYISNQIYKENLENLLIYMRAFRMSISTNLRYCMEIVIKSFISNNPDIFENKKIPIEIDKLIRNYIKENYDYKVKTLTLENNNNNCYFYSEHNFWDKDIILKNFQFLNSLVHYQIKNDPNLLPEKLKNIPDQNKIFEDYNKLKNIYEEIYNSLLNHVAFFEQGKYKIIFKNFSFGTNPSDFFKLFSNVEFKKINEYD